MTIDTTTSSEQQAAPAVDPSKLKNLRIQTGVVQRLNNELRFYSKEADSLKAKYEQLRTAHDEATKQSFEVWQDAQKVLPQVVLQLQSAFKELQFILSRDFPKLDVTQHPDSPEVSAVLLARTQLQRTTEVVPSLAEDTIVVQVQTLELDQEYCPCCVEISHGHSRAQNGPSCPSPEKH